MAAVLVRPHLRAALSRRLGLPAQPLRPRPFSSTPARKDPFVDIALAGPNALLNGIHALGVPWWATIPLTAVLVRGVFVYYLSSLPARKAARTTAMLYPLIAAKAEGYLWEKRYANLRKGWANRQDALGNLPKKFVETMVKYTLQRKAQKEIGKPFGVENNNISRYVLNFGMLVVFTEAIRMKCGVDEGMLGLILAPFRWIASIFDPQGAARAASRNPDAAEQLAQRIFEARHGKDAAAAASEMLRNPSFQEGNASGALPGLDNAATVPVDPSMTTGGIAWFTDLAAADTTFFFPSVLALTVLATTMLRPTVGGSVTGAASLTFGQKYGILIAAYLFVAGGHLPVGIMLYLIPSFALGWVQNRWLDLRYPMPPVIQRCSRPMWRKPKREWIDKRT